jgi:SAM-dependent methyltransferase/methyltransferase-like protein
MIDVAECFRRVIAMDETVEKLKSAYNAVAYDHGVYRQSHPDRLAVAAALRGITAVNVECCRVLEIGCGSGGNLIPMVEQLPGSGFLGIDLSERQIETGLNIVHELELPNIELRCQDIMEFPGDAGQFDYIIAHGVYSWVPRSVQQKLLAICRAHLAPRGIAFISYNTYPGWRLKEVAREMMLYHARQAGDAAECAARGRQIVQFVSEQTPDSGSYRNVMRDNQKGIAGGSDRYLLHDEMEVVNDPRYFWHFMEEANAHGLAYVGESSADPDPWVKISAPVREMIGKMSADWLEQEQYLDFLVNRTFRSSVLCLAETAAANASPAWNRVRDVYIAGNAPEFSAGTNAQGRASFKFGTGDYQVVLSDPRSIAVMRHLHRAWPSPVPFAELLSAYVNQPAEDPIPNNAAEILERVIEAYHSWGLVELWSRPSSVISPTPGIFPRTTRYARWQAAHSRVVTSLRHSAFNLDGALGQLIPLLDGTRDRKALAAEILGQSDSGIVPSWPHKNRMEFDELLDGILKQLASSRLILKEPEGG